MVLKLNSRFSTWKLCKKVNWPISQVLVQNQSPISAIPLIVRNLISQKTVLTGDPPTLGFLVKISFTPLLYHPGRCLGCLEKPTSSRNYNLFVWSAVFQPKWNDIRKSYKNYQNTLKSYRFLAYFQSLFNIGWKTAAQTN